MSESVEGPGETLRAAREAMEISCREVAEALNLPLHIVEAIEANDYEALPGAVFTRGYIRAYAKLLELDSDPVVARYPLGDDDTETAEVAPAQSMETLLREHARWVLGAAAVLVVLLVIWLWPSGDDPAQPQSEPPTVPASQPVQPPPAARSGPAGTGIPTQSDPVQVPAIPASAPPSAPAAAGAGDREGSPPATNAGETAPEPPGQAVPETRQAAPPAEAAAAARAGLRRITPAGSDRLWFRFTDDCWVEIKSATGANLYSDLSRGGQTLELVGQAPFRILLGYAPGVEVAFNDEAVALAPHTRNNVANLVLGQ